MFQKIYGSKKDEVREQLRCYTTSNGLNGMSTWLGCGSYRI